MEKKLNPGIVWATVQHAVACFFEQLIGESVSGRLLYLLQAKLSREYWLELGEFSAVLRDPRFLIFIGVQFGFDLCCCRDRRGRYHRAPSPSAPPGWVGHRR